MELRSQSVVMLWRALIVLLALGALVEGKDKAPKVKKTVLDFAITDLQYFENSETLIAHSKIDGAVQISTDGGEEWKEAKGIGGEQIRSVYLHPMDNKRAYAVGAGYKHYYTKDQGKSWDEFNLLKDTMAPTDSPLPFSFHAGNSDKVILNTRTRPCIGIFCEYKSYYTTDGFKTWHELRKKSRNCLWARATPNLLKSVADRDNDLILCDVEAKEFSLFDEGNRIVKSDDFFKTEMTPKLDGRNEIQGIINMVAVKGYLLAAQKSPGTSELRLYVSDDGQQWDRAEFPGKVEEDAYTVLESTDYSIQIHVRSGGPFNTMGTVYSSNSNGTYFTENEKYVNGNLEGAVDFEKVQGIQGIYLVNTVDNWGDVEEHFSEPKKLETKITFDDGRTFHELRVVDKDGKDTHDNLHLHSVTSLANSGRVFSSPAPGLVMGVGNTGTYLKDYNEGDLWVSDDAGLTWRFALKEAHKYEFGDQGSVLIAVNDEEATKEISYSLKHGRGEWETVKLDGKVRVMGLTTTPDSTSLKFVLVGYEEAGSSTKYVIYAIDFDGLHEGKCGSSDFEDWTARKDDDGKPDCLMGHTQTFRRRKPEVECFIDEEFKEPQMTTEDCSCAKKDFECEYNFVQNDAGDCVPTESFKAADGQCASGDKDEKFKAAALRLIPGNTCNRKNGENLDEKKEFACGDTKSSRPANGEIAVSSFEFPGSAFYQKVYMERTETSSGDDETVFVRTDTSEVFLTRDQGKTWKKVEEFGKDPITGILPHQYNQDMVFFLTNKNQVYYSVNRGKTFESFEVPSAPGGPAEEVLPLSFHVKKHNWLIWIGGENCEISSGGRCHYNAHYSTDRGENWQSLLHYCRRCEFIKREKWKDQDELIYCEQRRDEDPNGPMELVSTSDWFGSPPKEHFRDIVAFATMSDYIVVANKDSDSNLKIDASVDGQTFADAQFPKDFVVPHETQYTLLDSSTKSIFLQVTVSRRDGFEYGQLMKSNSNGTSYVSLLNAVNQNSYGFVDFEKMAELKGTALVNTVSNLDQKNAASKLLQTKITHNDGAAWSLIHNVADQTGDKFECDPTRKRDDCSLNLHGYTDREDPRDTFGSPSAVGLMMAVGNVGPHLLGDDQTDTFLTRDGGISWQRVRKGKYMWEYGDQGSIIAILQEGATTDKITYTLDEGGEWKDFKFAAEPITIRDLTTVPSDSSAAFIIWGVTSKRKLIAIKVDFSGLRSRTCVLEHDDSNRLDEGDYELWTPKHPMQDTDCLFGHITTLHRKKPDADCWNDKEVARNAVHTDSTNCTCTRQDFECDYNFVLNNDNTCSLVPGTEGIDPSAQCKADPNTKYYHETKGYRKIPLSTCDGGEEGRYWGEEKPCDGFEEEFEQKHGGLSGFGLFVVAVIIPFAAASAIGYYVYTNWDGKFGRIRLGDSGSYSSLDAEQPWIKYPVAALSAVVAIAAAIPLLLSAAWRQVWSRFGGARRYTTRESFARGRAAYAVVDQDEDELLGAEDDDV